MNDHNDLTCRKLQGTRAFDVECIPRPEFSTRLNYYMKIQQIWFEKSLPLLSIGKAYRSFKSWKFMFSVVHK